MIKAIYMGSIPLLLVIGGIVGLAFAAMGTSGPPAKAVKGLSELELRVLRSTEKAKLHFRMCNDGYQGHCIMLDKFCDSIFYHTDGEVIACGDFINE